ncbi:MAG TPA: hypothetical protein VNS33_18920 [Bradyrhizobium sp.]|nr:hypothetical protein [Bradyrhizobium sp.]
MSISLADLNWPAWPVWRNFMGLKALDPAIVEIAVILPALPGVFSN